MIVQGLWNPFRAPCSASPPTTARPTRRGDRVAALADAERPRRRRRRRRLDRRDRGDLRALCAARFARLLRAQRPPARAVAELAAGVRAGRGAPPGGAVLRLGERPRRLGAALAREARGRARGATTRPCSPTRSPCGSTTPGPSTRRASGCSTRRESSIPTSGLRCAAGELRGAGELVYGLMRRSAVERSGPFPVAMLADRLFLVRLALEGRVPPGARAAVVPAVPRRSADVERAPAARGVPGGRAALRVRALVADAPGSLGRQTPPGSASRSRASRCEPPTGARASACGATCAGVGVARSSVWGCGSGRWAHGAMRTPRRGSSTAPMWSSSAAESSGRPTSRSASAGSTPRPIPLPQQPGCTSSASRRSTASTGNRPRCARRSGATTGCARSGSTLEDGSPTRSRARADRARRGPPPRRPPAAAWQAEARMTRVTVAVDVKTVGNVIAGEERPAASGATFEKLAPATGEVISLVARSDASRHRRRDRGRRRRAARLGRRAPSRSAARSSARIAQLLERDRDEVAADRLRRDRQVARRTRSARPAARSSSATSSPARAGASTARRCRARRRTGRR